MIALLESWANARSLPSNPWTKSVMVSTESFQEFLDWIIGKRENEIMSYLRSENTLSTLRVYSHLWELGEDAEKELQNLKAPTSYAESVVAAHRRRILKWRAKYFNKPFKTD